MTVRRPGRAGREGEAVEFHARPDGVVECPFDHHSAGFAANFREVHDELRAAAPLVWSDRHGGFWVTASHQVVRRIAADWENFRIEWDGAGHGGHQIPQTPGGAERPRFYPGEVDGDEHDAYRLALNPHFSKRRVAELTPLIERHVAQTFDRALEHREFDLLEDVVAPANAAIVCEHLGLEVDEPSRFFHALMHLMLEGDDDTDTTADFRTGWQRIVSTVAARRAAPRQDVISRLVQWDRPPFDDEQIQRMVLNVALGAADTTKTFLGQVVVHLDSHPELRDELAADPELVTPAVDEFLRLLPVTVGLARWAVNDVEIEGVTIRKGDAVLLAFAGANHDPARYPDPRSFDLERGSAQHLGLGVGAHFCLGAWFAKSVSATVIRELLRRAPGFSVDRDGVVYEPSKATNCVLTAVPISLPAELSPGPGPQRRRRPTPPRPRPATT